MVSSNPYRFRIIQAKPLIWFIFLTLLKIASSADAEEIRETVAVGVGVVIQGDQAIARDRAVDDALRRVVEQAVGTLLESETRVRNYQVLSSDIYSHSSGYIQSYQVIGESIEEDLLKITIRAAISIESLTDDLKAMGILFKRLDKSRIMVMIKEENAALDEDIPLHQTKDILIEKLSAKGFSFVNYRAEDQYFESEDFQLNESENTKLAASLGLHEGADVVIIGKTLVEENQDSAHKKTGRFKSYLATVSIRAIKADTGNLLAMADSTATADHINPLTGGNEAVKKAIGLASENLIRNMIHRLNREMKRFLTVQLIINGLNDQLLFRLKNDLKSKIPGVVAIHQRFFVGNTANLDVEISDSSQIFADELTRKRFSDYDLSMISYSHDTIKIQLIPKGSLP